MGARVVLRAHVGSTTGVRQSPGAAMLEEDKGVMKSGAPAYWAVAAPEDGRTPNQLTVVVTVFRAVAAH
ncbi:MAG: hypothetical protein NT154_38015 [Verrucomicrobia bacterium]|nr:hypothetical protein [Verrucomicrobiota bacterium]